MLAQIHRLTEAEHILRAERDALRQRVGYNIRFRQRQQVFVALDQRHGAVRVHLGSAQADKAGRSAKIGDPGYAFRQAGGEQHRIRSRAMAPRGLDQPQLTGEQAIIGGCMSPRIVCRHTLGCPHAAFFGCSPAVVAKAQVAICAAWVQA